MDGEPIEVVEMFKYLEISSLKLSDANCNNDIRSRIGMAKQRMPNLHVVPIWRDRGINKELKWKLGTSIVRSFVWTVLISGVIWWTLTKADEKRLESAELWIYRWMLRISWTKHRTDQRILTELNFTKQLLGASC